MDIADRKFLIQQEETKFQASVSESVMTRVGAMTNFLANRELDQHDFNLNGKFNIITAPYQFGDGYITYPFPWEIVDVILYTGELVGSSGTTEVDVKWTAEGSGVYASIFSTTPKFTNGAAPNSWVRVGLTVAGFTAPVLSKSTFNAYDTLRLDVLQTTVGDVNGLFVKVFTRPRDPS